MWQMFALVVIDRLLIFDLTKHYGFYLINDVNLDGYLYVLDYEIVLEHYKNNYFDADLKLIEQYSNFLFRVCLNYLKDLQLV